MNTPVRKIFIRASSVFLLCIVFFYLLPMLRQLAAIDISIFANDQDGLNQSWQRSIFFALISTVFNIGIGLTFAIGLQKIPFLSTQGKLLSLLLLPIILGNVSVAFVGKLLFSDHPLFHQNYLYKFATLLLIEFWQYGTMYIYLFWIVIQNIPKSTWLYAEAAKMSAGEKLQDIILPSLRNLAILLFIMNFIFVLYEESKMQFIFKASRGTHTELISQYLGRYYQSISLLNPAGGINKTMAISWVLLGVALVAVLFFAFIFLKGYKTLITRRWNILFRKKDNNYYTHHVLFYFLLSLILLPILYVFWHTATNLQMAWSHLLFPLMVTFFAAFTATFIAVLLGILLRLGWQNTLSGFNNRSLLFFIGLFLLQLLPPIALLLTGFQWLKTVGYQSETMLYVIWIAGHTLLTLPILSSFITVTHFGTSNRELIYLESYRLSFWEIVKDSFLRRFVANYILTFLIAFSLIWNEAVINSVLSDFIPSFVSEMKMAVVGRSADHSKGMTYLLISILIASLSLWVWKKILDRADSA